MPRPGFCLWCDWRRFSAYSSISNGAWFAFLNFYGQNMPMNDRQLRWERIFTFRSIFLAKNATAPHRACPKFLMACFCDSREHAWHKTWMNSWQNIIFTICKKTFLFLENASKMQIIICLFVVLTCECMFFWILNNRQNDVGAAWENEFFVLIWKKR